MSARPTSSTSSTAPRPRSCSAASWRAAAAARPGRSTSRSTFLDFLAGNESYQCTPWGNPTRTVFGWQKPCYLLGEGYAEDLPRAHGRHRVGQVRRRQVREMRRLHGPLRLRGLGGEGHGAASVEGAGRGAARRAHRRRDGARISRSTASGRRSSSSQTMSGGSLPRFGPPNPGPSSRWPRSRARKAVSASSAGADQRRQLPGMQARSERRTAGRSIAAVRSACRRAPPAAACGARHRR